MSGHIGINRTLHMIFDRFFWPKMALDITRHVKSCVYCHSRKGVPDKPPGLLHCIKVEGAFKKVIINVLGPFLLSTKGNKMIIVTVDYLKKRVQLEAMPTGNTDKVAELFVNQILLRHGNLEQIITDSGKCFTSDLIQAVVNKLHTNHKTTSSYYPHANGAVERKNHRFAEMLPMYISSDQRDWIALCNTYALHTKRQDKSLQGIQNFFFSTDMNPESLSTWNLTSIPTHC